MDLSLVSDYFGTCEAMQQGLSYGMDGLFRATVGHLSHWRLET